MSRDDTSYRPTYLAKFVGEAWVSCPRCSAATLVRGPGYLSGPPPVATCAGCTFSSQGWPAGSEGLMVGVPKDPYFGYPLWLQREVGPHTLWAYNQAHLAFLREYVAASIRPSSGGRNAALASRLPKWMTEANHRDRVLKALVHLESALPS